MGTDIKHFGTFEGQEVSCAQLTDETTGVAIEVIGYGAIVKDWRIPLGTENHSVVLGFPKLEDYLNDDASIGAIVGRVANRTSGAQFQLLGETYTLPANAGKDHLHGGPKGLGRQAWKMKLGTEPQSLILTHHSPEGAMGYPAAVDFEVIYQLQGYRLTIDMKARPNKLTPINLVQHFYFNLQGKGDILDHQYKVNANSYTPLNERLVPTGDFSSVDNSFYDLRQFRPLRSPEGKPQPYDINYVLTSQKDVAAEVLSPDQKMALKLWTDQPGVQFYTGEYLNSSAEGVQGHLYKAFSGFCLEDQKFPDAMNHPHFPSILVGPENPYFHRCVLEIAPRGNS